MIEAHLLQDLSINGKTIDRGLIVRVQYIEAIEPVAPYLLVDIDDPNGALRTLKSGRETTCSATLALTADRAKIQRENHSIAFEGTLLKWSTDSKHPARYQLFFVHSITFALLEKKQVMVSAASVEKIFQKLIPGWQVQISATLPVTDFHCLHQRPIAQMMAWLDEHGCVLRYDRRAHELVTLTQLQQVEPQMEFYDQGLTSAHPALRVRYLGESYLMGEYTKSEPFHFDLETGPIETQAPPSWSPTKNELARRMGLKKLVPSLDFQSFLTFKIKLGEKFSYADEDYLVLRGSWQEYREQASMRILGAKVYEPRSAS